MAQGSGPQPRHHWFESSRSLTLVNKEKIMPQTKLNVALIRHTLSPEEVVALGARLCYSKA